MKKLILIIFLLISEVVYAYTSDPTNILPLMSSDSMSGFTLTRSGAQSGFNAYNALKRDDTTEWASAIGVTPAWFNVNITAGAIVNKYNIMPRDGASRLYDPVAWTFSGSNNGVNYTVLDTRSGVSMIEGQKSVFIFSNSVSYINYKFNITQYNGGTYVAFGEIEFFEGYLDPVDGVCGPAHASILSYAPSTGLCQAGTASQVTGTGPWAWTCEGNGTGLDANCSAQWGPTNLTDGALQNLSDDMNKYLSFILGGVVILAFALAFSSRIF